MSGRAEAVVRMVQPLFGTVQLHSLKTGRSVQLTFLGTGTSQGVPVIACTCEVCRSTDPRDQRTRSSVLVETEGKRLLIDAGPDMRQQMLREGITDIDAVLLTHEHMDHVAGMDDLRAFSFAHEPPKEIPIYANASTVQAVKRIYAYAFSDKKYPGIPRFDCHAVGLAPFDAAGVRIIPVEVMHLHMPVFGFRIGNMSYLTDAKTIATSEKEKLRGSDVLVVNALRRKEHISHFNLEEALALIEELAPKRAYLTHISHLMGLHASVKLPANVQAAYDGLKVVLE